MGFQPIAYSANYACEGCDCNAPAEYVMSKDFVDRYFCSDCKGNYYGVEQKPTAPSTVQGLSPIIYSISLRDLCVLAASFYCGGAGNGDESFMEYSANLAVQYGEILYSKMQGSRGGTK